MTQPPSRRQQRLRLGSSQTYLHPLAARVRQQLANYRERRVALFITLSASLARHSIRLACQRAVRETRFHIPMSCPSYPTNLDLIKNEECSVMTDLEACKQLLLRLRRRESVAARELRRALGEEHWAEYEGWREWMKGLHEQAKLASYQLRQYVGMLRIADLHDAHPSRNISLRRRRKRGLHWTSPDRKYERALEHLTERIGENVSLRQYLDRPFSPNRSYGSISDIGPYKGGMPRLWFHTENALPQSEERKIKTIRQLKMEALERAIEALSVPPTVTKKRKLRRLRLPTLRRGS
jgi:hypothetical protein